VRWATVLIGLALASLPAAPGAKPPHAATFRGVPSAALIAAASASPLKLIDAGELYCDAGTTLAAWLRALTATEVRAVGWRAGQCELVNDLNPLDAGGSYCVQATLTLKHPKDRGDVPEIEIYLEDPKGGRPGAVYAFRAMFDGPDGPDYIRFRKDFETEWRERFKDAPPPPCADDQ
jgi:hypothetical protein